tara:strand:+ start:2193 stop:3131 length:939 start_codon:yes stop_codon:yes gene_type:complete
MVDPLHARNIQEARTIGMRAQSTADEVEAVTVVNTAAIATNTTAIATNTTAIATNASAITSNATAIAAVDLSVYIHENGSNAMTAALPMGSNKITGLANAEDSTDAAAYGQLTSHTGDSTKHFTVGSIDHGSITGLTDDDHTQYAKTDGSRTITGGMSITASVPQLTVTDTASDSANKRAKLVCKSYTNSEEGVGMIYARCQNNLNKISIGGGDSDMNTSTATSFYVASAINTVSGTEIIRIKSTGMRLGGSANNDGSALLDMQSTTQGFLPPRMTTVQKSAISSPATGLCVFDTSLGKLSCFDGSDWNECW